MRSETAIIAETTEPGTYLLWCPACDSAHQIKTPPWQFDGDLEHPTIGGSILVQGVQWAKGEGFHNPRHSVATGEKTICHSFVENGQWRYLNDCTHNLAGCTVRGIPFDQGIAGLRSQECLYVDCDPDECSVCSDPDLFEGWCDDCKVNAWAEAN